MLKFFYKQKQFHQKEHQTDGHFLYNKLPGHFTGLCASYNQWSQNNKS